MSSSGRTAPKAVSANAAAQDRATESRLGQRSERERGGAGRPPAQEHRLPVVVDLDRDLLPCALVDELVIAGIRSRPAAAFSILRSAFEDPHALEQDICAAAKLAPGAVPLRPDALAALRQAHAQGHRVILLTSAHAALAERLCEAQGFIDEVVAVDAAGELDALAKAATLAARCPRGFLVPPGGDREALWARTAATFRAEGEAGGAPDAARSRTSLGLWAKALRVQQWVKNLLVFAPLVLAGEALDPAAWVSASAAFLAFGLIASATYLLNDLHDLEADRRHRSKRYRPLASGTLPIRWAVLAAPLGILAGLGLAGAVAGGAGLGLTAAYLAATLAYTFALKRYPILDVATLAGLFTLRLVAGMVFAGAAAALWLLVFSMFVFGSLALAKRHVEIADVARKGEARVPGRGYVAADGPVVLALGAATGMAAVLTFALFLMDAAGRHAFYVDPRWLWIAPVALFCWLGRIWLLCGRGELADDPVEFAVRDRASLALGAATLASFALACL